MSSEFPVAADSLFAEGSNSGSTSMHRDVQPRTSAGAFAGHQESIRFDLAFPMRPINYSIALMATWENGISRITMPSEVELCPSCERNAAMQVSNLSPWVGSLQPILAQLAAAHADINNMLEPWRTAGALEGNSGNMLTQQRDYVQAALQARARTICEVGFNAGHGSLALLAGSPYATALYAFDLAEHGYVEGAVEYVRRVAASPTFNANYTGPWLTRQRQRQRQLKSSGATWRQNAVDDHAPTSAEAVVDPRLPRRAGAAVHFYPGDSRKTLPAFRAAHPDVICDVAHVDGGHENGIPASDLANMLAMMRPGGIIMMDDVNDNCSRGMWAACVEPTVAWQAAVADGRITQLAANFPVVTRTERGWVIGVVNVPPASLEQL